MIPLIDIMLVMLAIVLTTATFIQHSKVDIELPIASSVATGPRQESLDLTVDREGNVFLNGEQVLLDQLDQVLFRVDSNRHINLRVDQRAEFGAFISVIDILKSRDVTNLSILVEPPG